MLKKLRIFTLIFFVTVTLLFAIKYFYINNNSVSVYFLQTKNNTVNLVSVNRKLTKNDNKMQIALENLINGPNKKEIKKGLFTEIPHNTKLLNIKINNKIIIINLSKEFELGGGSESMENRLEQLTYTALNSAKNKSVYLEIEGKKVDTLGGEGIEVPRPLFKK